MFKENIESIVRAFSEYKGLGGYLAIFFIAILYMFLKRKERNKNEIVFFLIYPIILLFVLINPIFNKLVHPIFDTIYFRLLWMLPLGVELAYFAVSFINDQNDNIQKLVVGITSVIVVISSGTFIYNAKNFQKVGNLYKLPDEGVRVTQLIGADDENYKKVIAPPSIIAIIPQIDSSVHLSNKREAESYNKIPEIMAMSYGDLGELMKAATDKKCNYIILEKTMWWNADIRDFGFEVFAETDNYVIYKDMEFEYE